MIIPVRLGEASYDIEISRGAINLVADKIMKKDRKVCVVTDSGVPTEYAKENIYNCCATDGENYAVMLTHYNDDDSTETKNVKINFENCTSPVKVSISILDEEHNLELTKEEYFTADKFSVILDMPLFTTALIKIEKQ